ncbi:HAD-like domain-containing protein [Lentinula guzmanii]|uniref:HAD-like domain-containing protein n=1 Tax=Lentinula guzmanii TaxID=2804957 RepID=A0AA38J7E2_9AGAR|nr:HAD-like domain-containing protein [Lentinula guzmanii]
MTSTFYADAVLFDMDGTLTDSIAAVEAAWGKVAKDMGHDPEHVIAATHGKRAIDNLAQFKPHILTHQMDGEVQTFEESILFFADAYANHGLGSRRSSPTSCIPESALDSRTTTPSLTSANSTPSPRTSSDVQSSRRPSFATRLSDALIAVPNSEDRYIKVVDSPIEEDNVDEHFNDKTQMNQLEAWQIEAAAVDRSVRILPGVKKMIESIPDGRYAVATSGAKTYAYGCMTRVGITPPPVTITADDKRLKAGKPAPDPFLLAAECLGFDPKNCVVFEDSPSGIRAGVASGAIVIAVCTSHERAKIENCGAHFVVDDMEKVDCELVEGQLRFTILA